MNPLVDAYIAAGCGRCPLGGTPDCKVMKWQQPLQKLRMILHDCGLAETIKWGVPCYTYRGKNIALLHGFKEYCALLFVNGALLADPEGILIQQTENTQAARQIRFTGIGEILAMESTLKAYILEAVEAEKAGAKVRYKTVGEFEIPDALAATRSENPAFKAAFDALTPGRQKAYILHFSAPTQYKTRLARVEKWMPHILAGKGLHDR